MKKSQTAGFTLVEIVVSIAVFALLTTVIVSYLIPTMFQTRQNQLRTEMASGSQMAFDAMNTSNKYASSFLPIIDSDQSDTYAPSGGWSYKGDGANDRVLITQNYITDKNYLDSNGMPVNERLITEDCQTWNDGQAYRTYNRIFTYNTIYFVENGTLYRRWLAPKQSAINDCYDSDPFIVQQTCPVVGCVHDGDYPGNPSFRAYDSVLATGVTAFTVDYYTAGDVLIDDPYSTSTPGEAIRSATYAKVTMTIENSYGNRSAEYTSTVVLRRINPNAV